MKLKFLQRCSLDGSGDNPLAASSTSPGNGLITGSRNAVICGRGLKDELYILQHEEEASPNVIHGTSAAASASAASTPTAAVVVAAHMIIENHPIEGNTRELTAINGDLEDSWLQISSPMEVKITLLSMKLELLQAENRRIEGLASESLGTKRELQSSRLKIKHLRRRLRSSRAQAREKMESLNRKIAQANEKEEIGTELSQKMKELEDLQDAAEELRKANLMMKQENLELEQRVQVLLKMKELEDLQEAAEELSKANLMMKQENLELEQRMASAKMLVSVLEDHQSEALEEVNSLKESNARLQKKIEKLEAKQKAEADEVRHLRWLNAKLISKDLSFKHPSPGMTTKTGNKDRQKRVSPILIDDDFKHPRQQEQQQQQQRFNSPQGSAPEFSVSKWNQASPKKSMDESQKLKILRKFKKLVARKNSKGNNNGAGDKTSGSVSTCSDGGSSAASSCMTSEEHSMASPMARSPPDANEKWSSNSAWISNGAFHARYAVQAKTS